MVISCVGRGRCLLGLLSARLFVPGVGRGLSFIPVCLGVVREKLSCCVWKCVPLRLWGKVSVGGVFAPWFWVFSLGGAAIWVGRISGSDISAVFVVEPSD